MFNLKFLPALIGASLVIGFVAYVAFYFVFLDLFVDFWWFQSLKLEFYFWLNLLYKFFLSGAVTLVLFVIFFFHFWVASSYLGLNPPEEIEENYIRRGQFQRFADAFMSGSIKYYTPVSFVLAFVIAVPFYDQWEMALLYFFGDDAGVEDTLYGKDVSFYLLSYPVFMLIQKELLAVAALMFCLAALLYWLEHKLVPGQKREFPLGAKIHLTVLSFFVFAFVVWGFFLERYSLLYTASHEPVFFGPGFVEIRYQLPLIWLGMAGFLLTVFTGGLFVFSEKHRVKYPFFISLVLFLGILGLPKLQAIPDLLQKYVVNPNPVRTEKPFIQNNIDATLAAYGLNEVDTVDVEIKLDAAESIETWGTQKRFENIPVWDREFIIDTYRQLQEIRPFYRFRSVDEDRYNIMEHTRQVNISAREVDISRLPESAQNWENTHMRYTHGFGAVVTPAAQDADVPLAWYLRDLNMQSQVGLAVKHPDIYYGQIFQSDKSDYAIEPNQLDVIGVAGTDIPLRGYGYGRGGIPVSSYFRKALLAMYFGDEKIFFSANMTKESRIKFRRNIVDRVRYIAPFLHLDKDPYLVMTNDRFYWMIDAYTLSNYYPSSLPTEDFFAGESQQLNYIRNSVKVTVDAVDGDVNFYIADPSDVIIKAYDNAYPGLFKSLQDMPGELHKHLRYPRDLYYLQMKVYAKYHQSQPELFYEQAETWGAAIVRGQPVLPYYQTMDFGNCGDREEFVLINPMTQVNRSNLSMIGVASVLDKVGCGSDYKPTITVYKFGKEVQVNGPEQIESLTQQVPEISAQFTLWGQAGSKVNLGRMVILPMGNTVLYVQPVYMLSEKNQIPELVRVIVTIGTETVMDRTLASAFSRLRGKFAKDFSEESKVTAPMGGDGSLVR